MKRMSFFMVMFGLSTFVHLGWAIEKEYSALTKAEQTRQKTHAIAAKTVSSVSHSMIFQENSDKHLFTIFVDGKIGWQELKEFYPKYFHNWIVDIDGNGLDDVLFDAWPGSQGLGLGCSTHLFLQQKDGTFKKRILPAERFELKDVVDLNGDKKYELVTCLLIRYQDHTYWTYHCWKIQDYRIVNVDKAFGFPRAVQYKFKPNTKRVDAEMLKGILQAEEDLYEDEAYKKTYVRKLE